MDTERLRESNQGLRMSLAQVRSMSKRLGEKCIRLESEAEQLRADVERLRKENKILQLKARMVDRFPFCPDHRDKVTGKECRECEVERLDAHLKNWQDDCQAVRRDNTKLRAEVERLRLALKVIIEANPKGYSGKVAEKALGGE